MDERIEVNMECPVNKWCDNKFEPKKEPNCDACDMFELPADYGHDMAKFNAYCETYNNAVKQCWESVSK